MGKKKVILDTNVLISAFGWEGNARTILRSALKGHIEIVISKKQMKEFQRVLEYPKFGFTDDQKKNILSSIFLIATIVETKKELSIIHDDPDDNMLLETASEHDVDFIITGDEHVLRVRQIGKTVITAPTGFLKQYYEMGEIL